LRKLQIAATFAIKIVNTLSIGAPSNLEQIELYSKDLSIFESERSFFVYIC
jgi:hypothetical protein